MTNNPLIPQSKLPQLGTTIFTQMSALAQQHQAINLSQGFPDFDGPRYLQERLAHHVAQGANQYAPMTGVQALREAIAQKTERLYGYQPDADSDITVTAGATEALYAAITALVRNGDEVICFDPSYDSYAPAIALSGGIVKRMALQPPHFRVDWQEFAALLSERTRLVILNTPHNPVQLSGSRLISPLCGRRSPGTRFLSLAMKSTSTSTFHNRAMPVCWRIRSCVSGQWRFLHLARPII